jgi:hypothetical protein
VWLVFGKTDALATVSANDALEADVETAPVGTAHAVREVNLAALPIEQVGLVR